MLPGTLSARSYRIAIVYNGQPEMSKTDNLHFYENLTAKGVELPVFEQKKSEIVLQNTVEGVPRNITRIMVGHFSDKFRLFLFEDYPNRTMEIFQETADAAWKVLSDIWHPMSRGGLALVEVTLIYTAASEGGNSTHFLLNSCLKIPKEALEILNRPLGGIGLKLVSPVLVTTDDKPPLPNADFNFSIETLLEDPSRLYIQGTVKWPSLPLPPVPPPQSVGAKPLPTFLNPECREPSWYLKQTESYIKKQIVDFLLTAKKK
jgi:hypothetical protein